MTDDTKALDDDTDYESLAFAFCTLLDRIEQKTTEPEVDALCKQRFAIAEAHGLKVSFTGGGPPASEDH